MPVTAFYADATGQVRELDAASEIPDGAPAEGLLWLDLTGPGEAERQMLAKVFGFEDWALEVSTGQGEHPPSIEELAGHLLLTVHGVDHSVESDIVETAELHLFVGEAYVVSCHRPMLFSVESIRARIRSGEGRRLMRSPAHLAHAIVEALIENVLPTVDRLQEAVEELEEEAIESPSQALLEALHDLKRSTLRVRRMLEPQRIVLRRVSQLEPGIVDAEAAAGFADLRDEVSMLDSLLASTWEHAENAMSVYLTAVSIRQNEAVRRLAVVATIFLPLSLLAGIYGMNFEHMPELGWRWGYFIVLGVMGVVLATAVAWLTAKRILSLGREASLRARRFSVDPRRLKGYVEGHAWPGRH